MAMSKTPSLRGGAADVAIQTGLLRYARNDELLTFFQNSLA